jgi:hypothetical protein
LGVVPRRPLDGMRASGHEQLASEDTRLKEIVAYSAVVLTFFFSTKAFFPSWC